MIARKRMTFIFLLVLLGLNNGCLIVWEVVDVVASDLLLKFLVIVVVGFDPGDFAHEVVVVFGPEAEEFISEATSGAGVQLVLFAGAVSEVAGFHDGHEDGHEFRWATREGIWIDGFLEGGLFETDDDVAGFGFVSELEFAVDALLFISCDGCLL